MKWSFLTLLALVVGVNSGFAQTIQKQTDPQPIQVTLSNASTKTNKVVTGVALTSVPGTNVVVVTSAVSSTNVLYLSYLDLTAVIKGATTTAATDLGYVRFESPTGTTLFQRHLVSYQGTSQPVDFLFPEEIPLPAGQTYRVVVDPSGTNSVEWTANVGGFER